MRGQPGLVCATLLDGDHMKNLNAALAEAGTRNPAAFGKVTLGDYQLAFEARSEERRVG